MRERSSVPSARLRGVAVAALAVLLSGAPSASAKDAPGHPVASWLEGVEVAPGIEHRLVVIHPLLAASIPAKPGEEISLGSVAPPDLLAFGRMEKAAKPRIDAVSFAADAAALFEGDVLRTSTADFA